jgi:CDP-paratose 2-epimerase
MKPVLITGGVGFIGTNVAHRLLEAGQPVIALDNLSRSGVEQNLRWLRTNYPNTFRIEAADIRDTAALARIVPRVSAIYHFAAQTAVTTSMLDPDRDFDVNARGTLCLLEAARACATPPPILYTSTNKVYGGLEDVMLHKRGGRYEPINSAIRSAGISEARPLAFHTPYGCSKGTADQYVLDYARSYGMPAVVFRMSCIYGPHQCGTEDQGWVAHFALRALAGKPISIYGDGCQVRDLLFAEDLVDAMLLAQQRMDEVRGRAFNIGGGVENVASLLDVVATLEQLNGTCEVTFHDWRPSDQRYYVSDTSLFQNVTGWRPKTDVATGISRMYEWLRATREQRPARKRAGREAERSSTDLSVATPETR